MLTILIATALSASALPAAAQDNSQSAEPTQQQRSRDGNGGERRICVNERVSESRMSRRICRTAQEWRDANDTADR